MKNSLIAALLLTVIVSCKKEKKDDLIPENQNINTDSINGEFRIIRDNIFFGDTLKYMQNIITAAFFHQKISSTYYYLPENSVSVGNVLLNNVQFREETFVPRYVDTSKMFFDTPFNWTIQGNSNFPGCQFTDTPDFPTYSTHINLPDTIYLSQPYTVNLGNYYSNSVELFIRGSTSQLSKFAYFPTSTITLTSTDYADHSLFYGYGKIYLIFNKEKYKTVNGKLYKFVATDFVSKTCVYLP